MDPDSGQRPDPGETPAVEADGLSKRFRPRQPATIVPVPWILGRWIKPAQKERGAPVAIEDDLDDDLDDDDLDEDLDRPAPVDREVWALRDVSFTLGRGGVLGVVGENAAGKSTLINVLSRVTPPTSGRVAIRGRVAPTMPVAAVFMDGHNSGVENVLQVARFFEVPRPVAEAAIEPIREFTELGQALEMPAKTYSSGQLVRLAYAVSLHLEPDVLLADEVVAVGDPAFRDRCIGLLQDRIAQGLTVVLATHSTKLVRWLCSEAIWLEGGRMEARGDPDEIVSAYEARLGVRAADRARVAPGSDEQRDDVVVSSAGMYDMRGTPTELLRTGDDAMLEITFELRDAPRRVRCVVVVVSPGGRRIRLSQPAWFDAEVAGVYAASVHIPPGTLPAGSCQAQAAVVESIEGERQTLGRTDFRFEAVGDEGEADGEPGGVARPQLPWDVVRIEPPVQQTGGSD